MGGSLYGFLERRKVFEGEKGDWELVLKTEPITGCTGSFREVFYNNQSKDIFDNIPRNSGFPDDISVETRAVMYSRIRSGHIDFESIKVDVKDLESIKTLPDREYGNYRWALDLDFYRNFENSAFWITGDQFRRIDFQQKVSPEKLEEVRSGLDEQGYGHSPGELQSFFKLNIDGREYSRLWITHNEEVKLSEEEVRRLVKGQKIEKDGTTLELEVRTMEEVLGNSWKRVWDIISSIRDRENEEVRLIFYWNH